MDKMTLWLDEKALERTKKQAKEQYKTDFSHSEGENLSYNNMDYDIDNCEINGDELMVYGELTYNGISMGSADVTIQIDSDLMVDMMEFVVKRINKMKAAIEALE